MFAHRKAVIGNEGNLTDLATNRPANDLARITNQTQSAFGGPAAVQKGAEGLQQAGQQEAGDRLNVVGEYHAPLPRVEANAS